MKEETTNIEKEYDKVRAKYTLSPFKDLNKEFELNHIEHKEFILRGVRRRMNDKLIFFCRIIEGVLYPHEKSPLNAYESGFFDDTTKEQLTLIHKKMMIYERQSLLLDIEPDEAKDAEFIKRLAKEWKMFKEQLTAVVRTMEHAWQTTLAKEKEGEYFG